MANHNCYTSSVHHSRILRNDQISLLVAWRGRILSVHMQSLARLKNALLGYMFGCQSLSSAWSKPDKNCGSTTNNCAEKWDEFSSNSGMWPWHKVKKSSTKSSTNLLFLVEVPCFAIPFELLLTNVHALEHSIRAAAVQQQAEALTKMLVASNWTWGELMQMHPEYSSTLASYTYRRIVKMWVFLSQSFWCGQCKYVCSIPITYRCLYKCHV